MTLSLTPHEWDTYGLAVVEKTKLGFKVKELKGGSGNFSFDWEVKAIRNGYEEYEVYRAKETNTVPHPNAEKEVVRLPKKASANQPIGQQLHKTHEGCVLRKVQ